MALPVLTLMLVIPGVGALAMAFVGGREASAKWVAVAFAIATLVLATLLVVDFYSGGAYLNLERSRPLAPGANATGFYAFDQQTWFSLRSGGNQSFQIQTTLGVDGISLPLLWLTPLLTLTAMVFPMDRVYRPRLFYGMLLVIQLALTGVFTSLNFLFFFAFWELVLIPMWLLIGIWGGPNKGYASMKFLIYTHVGSVGFVLLSIFLVAYNTGTLDMVQLLAAANSPTDPINPRLAAAATPLFVSFLLGFGIKLPMVPFHTWLPDAHVEAPTAGSVILAGLLLKMGGYGILRVCYGMFPGAAADLWWIVAIFGVVSMIYASIVTLVQIDLKRLIAYSSIGHMGFVLLGVSSLSTIGILGAAFQLFNHGLVTAVLFMLAGAVHHATGTREIPLLRGLGKRMPVFSFILILSFMASMGLPSLNSFWSEVMTFTGTYQGWPELYKRLILVPLLAIVLTGAYYLWTMQKVIFGEFNGGLERVRDVTPLEAIPMAALLIIIVFVGLYPAPWVNVILGGVHHLPTPPGGA